MALDINLQLNANVRPIKVKDTGISKAETTLADTQVTRADMVVVSEAVADTPATDILLLDVVDVDVVPVAVVDVDVPLVACSRHLITLETCSSPRSITWTALNRNPRWKPRIIRALKRLIGWRNSLEFSMKDTSRDTTKDMMDTETTEF